MIVFGHKYQRMVKINIRKFFDPYSNLLQSEKKYGKRDTDKEIWKYGSEKEEEGRK